MGEETKNQEKEITDKDIQLELLKFISTGNESTFNMLRDIVAKFFPILFYLNGGAAIAILAFVGNLVKYDDKYLIGLLNSLGCFAIGAFLTVLSLGASYVSQGYYQEFSEKCWVAAWGSKFMDVDSLNKDDEFKKGKCWRARAMWTAAASGLFFLVGCSVFICTFWRY